MDYEHTRERPVSQGDSIWFAVMGVKAQLTDAYKPRDPCDILVERLGGRTPQRPAGMPMELYSMIEKCLQIECTKRPKITDLKVVLATLEGNSKPPMMDFHERLVAYVVPDDVVVQDVTDTCRAVLPGYMVPSSVAGLACWPLTASGKINRALLPLPTEHIDVQHSHNMQGVNQQIAEHVCSVVSSVLHLKQVHITNHFFRDLGGTSLLAVQVMNALRQEGLQFHSVRLLFKHPVLLDFVASTYDIGEPESTFDTTMSQEFVEQRRSCVCATLICLVQVSAGTLVTLLLCVTPVALVNYLHVVVHSVVHDVGHGVGPSLAFQALVGGSLTVVGAISVLLLAVIMKWLLIGRLSPSQHRVYSCFFIRWWLSQRAISSLPVRFVCSFVRDTPILALFYSLLGARLGSNCRIAGTGLSHCAPHYASLLLCASQLSMTFPRCPSLNVPLSACSPSSLCLLLSSCRCASHCLCLVVSLTVPYAQVQVGRDIQCRIGI